MGFPILLNVTVAKRHSISLRCQFQWFPEHPALATGLIVAGFGGGALIFNQVITGYINPDNLKPDLITPDGDR